MMKYKFNKNGKPQASMDGHHHGNFCKYCHTLNNGSHESKMFNG